jgi:two-component system response regulator RegX3
VNADAAAPSRRIRLLVVEDDPDLGRGLTYNLEREGYDVRVAKEVAGARRALEQGGVDLVLLDLALPDGDGLDLLQSLRAEKRGDARATPVICLTARGQETDVVAGLKLGADDYVTKPFGLAQLFARIEAVLRRTRPAGATSGEGRGDVVELDGVRVDLASHKVERRGAKTAAGGSAATHVDELTPIEADLLRYFLARRGRVLDRAQILKDLWGVGDRHATRTLDNHVARLRRKIEPDPASPRFLVTAHGVGYRFEAESR